MASASPDCSGVSTTRLPPPSRRRASITHLDREDDPTQSTPVHLRLVQRLTVGDGNRSRERPAWARWMVAAGVALVLVGFGFAWVLVPQVLYHAPPSQVDPRDPALVAATAQRETAYITAVTSTRTAMLAMLAGLGALATVAISYSNSRIANRTLSETILAYAATERDREEDRRLRERQANQTEKDAAERRVTELYAAAADQLGSDKAPVRLAGLYALERLAQHTEFSAAVVVELLCAYLRMPPPLDEDAHVQASPIEAYRTETPPDQELDISSIGMQSTEKFSRAEQQVRRTALLILSRHHRLSDLDQFWEMTRIDLASAELRRADFAGCDLRGADFTDSDLTGADFTAADLTGADLSGATLREAHLTRATLRHARLLSAKLVYTWLDNANVDEAKFMGACFARSDLRGTDFQRAWVDQEALNQAYARPDGSSDNLLGER